MGEIGIGNRVGKRSRLIMSVGYPKKLKNSKIKNTSDTRVIHIRDFFVQHVQRRFREKTVKVTRPEKQKSPKFSRNVSKSHKVANAGCFRSVA